jgi:hypothetical protein
MTRPILLVLAGLAIALTVAGEWPAWQNWRLLSEFYEAVERSDDIDEPITPSAHHFRAIRKLPLSRHTRVESGRPIVDASAPDGSADMEDDLAPIIGTRDKLAIAAFNVEVSRALAWALEHGALRDGCGPMAGLNNATMESETIARHRASCAATPKPRSDKGESVRLLCAAVSTNSYRRSGA